MEKETWRFIDSGRRDPAFNMALDEALLFGTAKIRFRRPSAFTAGIRQRFQSAISKISKRKSIWMPSKNTVWAL